MIFEADIAIIGAGFAGSILAAVARRLGRSVILLERGRHPRFAIGESFTPLANLLLEDLATRYALPRLLPLAKWGSWQRTYSQLACGLKRGFTFYHHAAGQRFAAAPDRSDQLLVAASPSDEISDTHWYRADVDHFLVNEAMACGTKYLDEACLDSIEFQEGSSELRGRRCGGEIRVRSRFVFDASGPRGLLNRALRLGESSYDRLPPTQALYSHFRDVCRLDTVEEFRTDAQPPYPPDDAAVHHVFDGGWIWVLRFNNGITSAGIAAEDWLADELQLKQGAVAWQRALARFPSIQTIFQKARPVVPFVHAPRLWFRSNQISGPGWALLPSAAGFVDPLLSTGIPLTLLGIRRLAQTLKSDWGNREFNFQIESYASQSSAELEAVARLVAALYANMGNFANFVQLSMLYFAAASFAETQWRLGKKQALQSFLLHDHPQFRPAMRSCLDGLAAANTPTKDLAQVVSDAVDPINIAGLCSKRKRNWYAVNFDDLRAGASKLNVDTGAIERLIRRMVCAPFAGVEEIQNRQPFQT